MKSERIKLFIGILLFAFIIEIQLFVFVEVTNANYTIPEFDVGKGSLEANVEVVTRYTHWNWFEPYSSTAENSYDYIFTRTRLGLSLNFSPVRFYMQAQDVHKWGIPDDAVAAPPQGPLGCGAIYYLHGGEKNYHSTIQTHWKFYLSKVPSLLQAPC